VAERGYAPTSAIVDETSVAKPGRASPNVGDFKTSMERPEVSTTHAGEV
jgi:hypothetical protein